MAVTLSKKEVYRYPGSWYWTFQGWATFTATRTSSGKANLSGTVYLSLEKGNTSVGWYMNRIRAKIKINSNEFVDIGVIKGNTGSVNDIGSTYSKAFNITQSLSATATSFSVTIWFQDEQNTSWVNKQLTWSSQSIQAGNTGSGETKPDPDPGGETDPDPTPPPVIEPSPRSPSSTALSISSVSCTGTTVKVTVGDTGYPTASTKVIYGTNQSSLTSTAGTIYSGSGTITINGLKPLTKYYVQAVSTNSSGTSKSSIVEFTSKGGIPTSGEPAAESISPWRLKFDLPDVKFAGDTDCQPTTTSVSIKWWYSIDGVDKEFTESIPTRSSLLSYDTGFDPGRVPDDEIVTYLWTITTNIGTLTKQSTVYAQPQYDAFVCGKSTDYEWVEANMYVSSGPGNRVMKKVRRVENIEAGPMEEESE